MKSILGIYLLFGILSGILIPAVASAYLDPGSVSLVFQMVAGIFVATLVFSRLIYARVKQFFYKKTNKFIGNTKIGKTSSNSVMFGLNSDIADQNSKSK